MSELNGSVLGGRYRLEARIGSGGMGEVYRGVDTVLDRTVAIKILLPQFARDVSFVDRFRREAQAAARLNHPNIVGIYDSGADGETQFIVMEFIQGRTLDDFVRSGGRFTAVHAVEVAEKICDALAYAHVAGVIHRDIKPANVMVTRKGEVKVMDFGIARIVVGPQTAPQTSAVLGTAAYISPEQAQGQPVDGRSDIYSLGAVLYEMLAGRPPFTGDSPVAVAYKQVNEAPALPSIANHEVSPLLDAVLMRALAKNPANRYQTADEFRADLERARLGQDVLATPLMPPGDAATQVISRPQATAVLPPQEPPPGSGRKVWLGVLIGVIVVAVLAGAGYLLAQGLLSGDQDTPKPVPVPTVIGFTQERAIQEIEDADLKPDVKTKVSDTVKPGRVVDQDPVAGTTLAPGSTVTIFVAKAPPTVVVPTFTGLTLEDAQTLADENHLVLRTTEGLSDTVPVGSIISQDPPPGDEVPDGSEVQVVVSAPPATVTVTDVTCLSFGAAKAALRDQGLVAVLGGTAPLLPQCPNPSRISLQDPAAGNTVDTGSTVTLFTGDTASPSGEPTGPTGPTG
jgi:beta-lactam-binding protein with PASTA domain/predicted Ser/Thr protein kinase